MHRVADILTELNNRDKGKSFVKIIFNDFVDPTTRQVRGVQLFTLLARRLSGYDDALMERLAVSAGVHRHADAAWFEHKRRCEAMV